MDTTNLWACIMTLGVHDILNRSILQPFTFYRVTVR